MNQKDKRDSINSIAGLYEEFQSPVFRYLFRLTGSQNRAEELTQEVFFQALISLPRFRGDAKVSTWLYKIARNVYLSDTRAQRHRDTVLRTSAEELYIKHEYNLPEKALDQKILEERIIQVLQELPENYRTVIILKEVEGLSHHEIADILGKKDATTKVLLYRAKQRFQELYKGKEG